MAKRIGMRILQMEAAKIKATVISQKVDRLYRVVATAPSGKIWIEGGGHQLIDSVVYTGAEVCEEVRGVMLERIRLGVVDCRRDKCPICAV